MEGTLFRIHWTHIFWHISLFLKKETKRREDHGDLAKRGVNCIPCGFFLWTFPKWGRNWTFLGGWKMNVKLVDNIFWCLSSYLLELCQPRQCRQNDPNLFTFSLACFRNPLRKTWKVISTWLPSNIHAMIVYLKRM